jgi:hypothetical protein
VILETSRAQNDLDIEDDDSIGVMRQGSIYMDFSEVVTAGELVGLTLATGLLVGLAQGASSTAAVQVLPGLRIVETIAAAGLAIVEVDLFAETGASGGDFDSGEYTPTLTDVTNVAASVLLGARYMRIGSTVTVHFALSIDATATGATELDISLPVASNFTDAEDCSGLAVSSTAGENQGSITADVANDRAQLDLTAVGTGVIEWRGSFSYAIL